MSLLEEVNARVAAKNAEILAARIAVYDKIEGPRTGDYMEFPNGKVFRIAHDWGNRVQPASCSGDTGSFYFSVGSMSYSGGLTPSILTPGPGNVLTEEPEAPRAITLCSLKP